MLAATLLLCFIALSMAAGPYDTFYEDKGRADPTASHPITFFVKDKQDFVDSCPQMLEAIATPESAQWNKQLSYGEMRQFVDEQSFERVHRFAVRHFGEERVIVSDNHDMVLVPTATVAEVETAFNCELHEFAHTEDAAFVARRPVHRPKLSHHIERSVDAISGLNHLPPHRAGQKPLFSTISSDDEEARKRQMGGTVSPQLLWRYYGVSNRTMASAAAKNSIFAALGQSFAPSDLAAWQQQFMLPTTRIQQVIGPNTPTSCASNPNNCIEASLDVQQITSTAQLGDTTFHSIDQSVQDIFLAWIQAVQSEASPPLVNSISYGSIATEDPKYDMEQFNHAACKAGLRGITVVVASGDDGVANFQARGNPNACQGPFQPSYPATSPFVLAVGATQGPEQQQPEVVCSSATGGGITSGGGFSDLFKTPDYQKRTVQAYLAAQQAAGTLPPTSKFNRYGRGYPDVAAMGHNYQIEVGGNLYEGSGTSASAPVTAALVSLINGGRLAAGKKSIGFLNPILYNTMAQNRTHFFHQITSGNNKCTASSVCCQDGFYADPNGGWNAATGNGSPKFQAWWALLVEQLP